MRQQIHSQISQSEASLFLGLIQLNNLQIVPKNGLLISASKLQVFVVIYKLNLQVIFTKCHSAFYKCSFCLTVILTVKLF